MSLHFGLQVISKSNFNGMRIAAENGNAMAIVFVNSLMKWCDDIADAPQSPPRCMSCHAAIIMPDDFGGLAVAHQDNTDHCWCAAFCVECQNKGCLALSHILADAVQKTIGAASYKLHTLQ
jgi:hypothetical protein